MRTWNASYKVGQVVRLNFHGDIRPELFVIYKVKTTEQFAYSLKRFRGTKLPLAGTWQEYQLAPITPEEDPELCL